MNEKIITKLITKLKLITKIINLRFCNFSSKTHISIIITKNTILCNY